MKVIGKGELFGILISIRTSIFLESQHAFFFFFFFFFLHFPVISLNNPDFTILVVDMKI